MRLLKVEEVAERLGVNVWTVRKMVAAGELPVVRLGEAGRGRAVRVPDEDLDEWIRRRTENKPVLQVVKPRRRA